MKEYNWKDTIYILRRLFDSNDVVEKCKLKKVFFVRRKGFVLRQQVCFFEPLDRILSLMAMHYRAISRAQ